MHTKIGLTHLLGWNKVSIYFTQDPVAEDKRNAINVQNGITRSLIKVEKERQFLIVTLDAILKMTTQMIKSMDNNQNIDDQANNINQIFNCSHQINRDY